MFTVCKCLPEFKQEEIAFAKAIYESTSAEDKEAAKKQVDSLLDKALANHPVFNQIALMSKNASFMTGSTDVADVSWNVPTAQCVTATWAYATPFHTWQAVVPKGKRSMPMMRCYWLEKPSRLRRLK